MKNPTFTRVTGHFKAIALCMTLCALLSSCSSSKPKVQVDPTSAPLPAYNGPQGNSVTPYSDNDADYYPLYYYSY